MFTARTKLISKIPQAERNIRRRVEEAVGEAAQDAAVLAIQFAPVKTGELRRSITAYRNTRDNWIVGATAAHALFVEMGTANSPAQPFLRPAAEAVRPRLLKKLARMKVL